MHTLTQWIMVPRKGESSQELEEGCDIGRRNAGEKGGIERVGEVSFFLSYFNSLRSFFRIRLKLNDTTCIPSLTIYTAPPRLFISHLFTDGTPEMCSIFGTSMRM